ncbi:hypothetical protein COCSADRAFT_30236 [Bipolaris sorokiniana ND90Pr]|uniref:Uncharacterized protein n=1 Tax=Cochliobolus sativus (strain ND90Pr / ATCC 201652) TaxID=665912 RepID=M2QYW5_COCSN|nr:uncharacterized protein COCSADRAFT_30236 [Bipolaris sorokiniana ND90Pr]EMD60214.1 hypothetical protein COCSADRAFT_30236 [Bipolaris sorokiniana ND90Pr]
MPSRKVISGTPCPGQQAEHARFAGQSHHNPSESLTSESPHGLSPWQELVDIPSQLHPGKAVPDLSQHRSDDIAGTTSQKRVASSQEDELPHKTRQLQAKARMSELMADAAAKLAEASEKEVKVAIIRAEATEKIAEVMQMRAEYDRRALEECIGNQSS